MTPLAVADKIGIVRARRVTDAALSLLTKAGVQFEEITSGHYHVGGFSFWPVTGYWRSHDGRARGYGAGGLIALAKAVQP